MNRDNCNSIIERYSKVVAHCQHLTYFPLAIASIDNATITDADGNTFIDFLSSASCLNMGSCNPAVVEAVKEQIDAFSAYIPAYTYNEKTTAYAERLTASYPGGVKAKIAFGNCGSDANDAAVKFARGFTRRPKIVVFENGYYGNTYCASTMTTFAPAMHDNVGPLLPEIYAFPFYDAYMDDETVERECLKDIHAAFENGMPADQVAAVIIEPIQGDGGMIPAHPIFMKKLYELCKKHGILFISEEVQQAFYRTGKMFAIEHYDIIPDGIVMGKSIGAGFPMSAFMAREEIMDALPSPAHVFSMSGFPTASAAGIAAYDFYQTDEFQHQLAENIETLWSCAEELMKKHPDMVLKNKGIGMSMGIRIKDDEDPNAPFKILYRCYEKGLIVITAAANNLRIQPPLTIPKEQIVEGFEIIAEAIDDYKAGIIPDDVLKYCGGW